MAESMLKPGYYHKYNHALLDDLSSGMTPISGEFRMQGRQGTSTDGSTNRMFRPPDFVIIGAMKCATTTLHEQLAGQPRIMMSFPKEPNFFSDDDIYARGFDWYFSLFADADDAAVCGESSTHYTKLPTYPETVRRMSSALDGIKLIYVMRHPIDRLISHYIHEVTTGRITEGIHEAIDRHPELVDFGRYHMQISPYLAEFGPESILPVFFRRLVAHSQDELERIGRFIGAPEPLRWDDKLKAQNVGSERLRRSVLREIIVRSPVLTTIRRHVVPKPVAETIKSLWRARTDPPRPTPELVERLRCVFDEDLEQLGAFLGVHLDCKTFNDVTGRRPLAWSTSAARL
jgi:hypothetical protein